MKRLLFITFLGVLFFGCKPKDKEDYNEFILKGNIDTDEIRSLTLEELTTCDLNFLDSTKTDASGNFAFRQEIEEAGFYILRESRDNYVTLLIEPGEAINLEGDADDLPLSYQVEGSEGSILLMELNKRLRKNIAKVDSLADLYRESRYSPNFEQIHNELNKAYTEIFEGHRQYVINFIEENPHSLASIIALYQYFGDKVILKETEDFEYFESLSKSLAENYPTNRHVINLKKRVSDIKRARVQRQMAEEKLAVGNPAPEIVLPDPDGNSIALSSLKGNVVLLDFWASWHDPCKISNRILKEIYDKYNHRGFEIYGVSLDRTREQWINAINRSDIDWIQVSDLRYFSSPVVSLYNIEGIPYTVLIDREGKIVAKDIDHRVIEEYLEDLL